MIQQLKLVRLLPLLAAGMLFAPGANAACACMCVDATPMYVCSGFVNSQNETAECTAQLSCPAVDDVPASGDPVAALDPPHDGVECDRRDVYRPDKGGYEKRNVCREADDEDDDDDD